MMHGKAEVDIKDLHIHLYPEMYYPTDQPHFVITLENLLVLQDFYDVSIIIKHLIINKDKLKKNETSLVHIPQVEVSVSVVFEHHPGVDHYLHYVRTEEEFKERMANFKAQDIEITMKLNLASFYTPHNVQDLVSYDVDGIISNALSPYVHYQFSYLPLIIQTIDAFTIHSVPFKILDKEKRQQLKEFPKEEIKVEVEVEDTPYQYELKLYAFFSDL